MSRYLSKSKLLSYFQCPRRLYLEVHQPGLVDVSSAMRPVSEMGQLVGELARSLYPDGVLIESQKDLAEAIRQTEVALTRRPKRVVFEGAFQRDGVLVRTDLLLPAARRWQLVEVTSSMAVKDYHRADAAIQRYVLDRVGIPVGEVAIRFINTQFVYPGNNVYHEVKRNGVINSLFKDEDVTDETRALAETEVPAWVDAARKTLAKRTPPPVTDRCDDPFPCPFRTHCYPDEPTYPLFFREYLSADEMAELRAQQRDEIQDISAGPLTNVRREWPRRVTVAVAAERLPEPAETLSHAGYPRYYLDFDTVNFAVPIWKGVHPYQHLPYQWSCDVEQRDGTLEHREFSDVLGDRPSRPFAEQFIEQLGDEGPVLVFDQGAKERILTELAQHFRKLAPALTAIRDRLVELPPITSDTQGDP